MPFRRDGFGIEYTGEPSWSLAAHGIDEKELGQLTEGVAAGLEIPLPRD